jgi:hypothetical protein
MKNTSKTFTYTFKGIVYPTRVNFILKGLPEFNFVIPEWGIEGIVNLSIVDCEISVSFESQKEYSTDTDPNIETLKNYIDRIARQFVDAYCFAYSYNYDIDIESVKCKENNFEYTFPVRGEWNIKGEEKVFINVLNVMMTTNDSVLGLVLSDFRRAIKYPDMTAMFCFRSLETLRREHFDDQSISDNNKRDKDGWILMGRELNLSRNDVYEKMRNFAKNNRHGEFPKITYKDREEIMNYCREVINKFIKWKLSNHV